MHRSIHCHPGIGFVYYLHNFPNDMYQEISFDRFFAVAFASTFTFAMDLILIKYNAMSTLQTVSKQKCSSHLQVVCTTHLKGGLINHRHT